MSEIVDQGRTRAKILRENHGMKQSAAYVDSMCDRIEQLELELDKLRGQLAGYKQSRHELIEKTKRLDGELSEALIWKERFAGLADTNSDLVKRLEERVSELEKPVEIDREAMGRICYEAYIAGDLVNDWSPWGKLQELARVFSCNAAEAVIKAWEARSAKA